ncbi:MAG: pyrroline-5-carboxylate reductase [Gemmatimonadetes bacterium]|nr:MAG: pyrroline-5-carboxylate reductase [Gemmatimonadota bacterium]PYP28826.1 MAG: pyrroline-5-carboxylate reductase [Gemmatimonadota bacterium]
MTNQRVAVLGLGKIGTILLQGLLKAGVSPSDACATVRHGERARALSTHLPVTVGTDNRAAARAGDVILIAVKPQNVGDLLDEIRADVTPAKLVVSAAASVPTSYIEGRLERGVPVVRAMPNTPCQVGAGMTGICRGSHATDAHLQAARQLFDTVGRTVVVDEKHMDAVTGLSASGPAFVYIILESLAEAGVKVGLPRDVATLLAAQTLLGAAKVALETGDHPALLKDAVTTPAGCTIDGILELEEGKLRVTLIKAVVKATQRAKELMFEK